jgi:hypothetical protein
MAETEPFFFSHLATFIGGVAILTLFGRGEWTGGCGGSLAAFAVALSKASIIAFLFVVLVMGGMYVGNMADSFAVGLANEAQLNIRRFHFLFANFVGCFAVTLGFWFVDLNHERENTGESVPINNLPSFYNEDDIVVTGDGYLASAATAVADTEKQVRVALRASPGVNSESRARKENVHVAAHPIGVLGLAFVFTTWMHAVFIAIEAHLFLADRPEMTQSNIVAVTANVIVWLFSWVSMIRDNKRNLVGVKSYSLFSAGSVDTGFDGHQFWIYYPPASILAFELLSFSAHIEFFNGIDHMILYLSFVGLCYVLVSFTTSCATWLQIRVYITTMFLLSCIFYPAVAAYNTDIGFKVNNTISGVNTHFGMMDFWGGSERTLGYKTYHTNFTVATDMSTTGSLAYSSTALICGVFVMGYTLIKLFST